MKVINFLFCIVLICLLFGITSCRKGEKDPFFSLRSRDSRLMQTWTLTKAEGSIKHSISAKTVTPSDIITSSSDSNTTFTFDGSILRYIQIFRNISGSYTSFYGSDTIVYESASLNLILKKHGAVEISEKGLIADNHSSSSILEKKDIQNSAFGNWLWQNSSKNKDNLILQISGSVFIKNGTYYVNRLAHNELILTRQYSNTFERNSTKTPLNNTIATTGLYADEYSENISYTFDRKK